MRGTPLEPLVTALAPMITPSFVQAMATAMFQSECASFVLSAFSLRPDACACARHCQRSAWRSDHERVGMMSKSDDVRV